MLLSQHPLARLVSIIHPQCSTCPPLPSSILSPCAEIIVGHWVVILRAAVDYHSLVVHRPGIQVLS